MRQSSESDLRNQFRGIVSGFRSKRFSKKEIKLGGLHQLPFTKARRSLRELLLHARTAISESKYRHFQRWIRVSVHGQLPELERARVGIDHLRGVYTDAPVVELRTDIKWVGYWLVTNLDLLKKIVSEKSKVDRYVQHGEYNNALASLNAIDENWGLSFWSVQLRIALTQTMDGLEAQKKLAAELRTLTNRGLLGFMCFQTSTRCEPRTTIGNFRESLADALKSHRYYDHDLQTYLMYKIGGVWPSIREDFAHILRVEQSHSLIDLYDTFVLMSQELFRNNLFEEIRPDLTKIINELAELKDPRIWKLNVLHGGVPLAALPRARDEEMGLALFDGEIAKCATMARPTQLNRRNTDAWDFVYGGFALSLGKPQRKAVPETPSQICRLIASVLRRDDFCLDSIAKLEKLCVNFGHLPLYASLRDIVLLLHRPRADAQWAFCTIGMNSGYFGPEDIPIDRPQLKGLLASTSLKRNSLRESWQAMREDRRHEIGGSQTTGRTIFSIVRLLSNGEDLEALSETRSLRKSALPSSVDGLLALFELHALKRLNDVPEILRFLAHEGSSFPLAPYILPVQDSLASAKWAQMKPHSEELSVSLGAYFLWQSDPSEANTSLVQQAIRTFLKANGLRLPSECEGKTDEFAQSQLKLFLRDVCELELLDGIRAISSSTALLEERARIYELLEKVDPENSLEYSDHRLAIDNKLAIEEGGQLVDRTRIHVDENSFKRWASANLKEDFGRYKDLLNINDDTNTNTDAFYREIVAIRLGHTVDHFDPENEADILLIEILNNVFTEFLTNSKFGLDFYLSQRIRHQQFASYIRGPVEVHNLITTKNTALGTYQTNSALLSMISGADAQTIERVEAAAVEFATAFDDMLSEAKEIKFQIYSEEKPEGLFVLRLTPKVVATMRALVGAEPDIDTFIELATTLAWSSLEPSLKAAREYVRDNLKPRMITLFDGFRAQVRNDTNPHPLPALDAQIVSCSTAVQRELDDASLWFSRPEGQQIERLFTVRQATQIAVDSTRRRHKAFDPKINLDAPDEVKIYASDIILLHDAIAIGIDNVREHSDLKHPEIWINVSQQENSLVLEILSTARKGSEKRHETRLERIREQIETNSGASRAKREGRSGFLKLAMVAGQSERGKLEFGFVSDTMFRLAVTYSWIQLS